MKSIHTIERRNKIKIKQVDHDGTEIERTDRRQQGRSGGSRFGGRSGGSRFGGSSSRGRSESRNDGPYVPSVLRQERS